MGVLFLMLVVPVHAHADEPALTRARVAELVRSAPEARVSNAEVAVANATATAAGVLSLENPVISGMGGLRLNPDGTRPFAGVATVSWPIDLGGQSGARADAAKAAHRSAHATAGEAQRRLLLTALLQHAQVLRDERQLAITAERRALAERLAAAATRRRTAGEVAEIDVALASLQLERDRGVEASMQGARDADQFALFALLGMPTAASTQRVVGTLVPEGEPAPMAKQMKEIDQRSDVRAANASLDAARARASQERASRWPTISVLAQYERDDGANIGLLGVAVPIPILNANRVGAATATAEIDASGARLAATRASAAGQLQQLYIRYLATKKALESLRLTAGLVVEASRLSARGYELGENDLGSVLLVRREALDAQVALLEAEHAHAVVKIELLVGMGKIPQ